MFHPHKSYVSVDYCSISLAVRKKGAATGEGTYGEWELKIASDATHIGLEKSMMIDLD